MALAGSVAFALDPVRLARTAEIEPDGWQARVLRSLSPRVLLNCSRQSGKSTITALLALDEAMSEPGALVLLLAPVLRQSSELFLKVKQMAVAAGAAEGAREESALRLTLGNGSRIIALPGKEQSIRCFSAVRLLVIDEAARVPNELYASVRPMLAVSGGRLVALSTPFGTRGWWYEAWRSNEPWDRYEVPATECPRISPEFLQEERRTLGDFWFDQEYMCRFLDAESAAFRREDIDRCFAEVETWKL